MGNVTECCRCGCTRFSRREDAYQTFQVAGSPAVQLNVEWGDSETVGNLQCYECEVEFSTYENLIDGVTVQDEERIAAAAPDLLEALEALSRSVFDVVGEDPNPDWKESLLDGLDCARAAIAKAKGEKCPHCDGQS